MATKLQSDINSLQCTGYKFEIQSALVNSNPIIYDYNIHVLQLHNSCEQRDALYNGDNSALIDATEQEAETKELFSEFHDEYISLLDKIKPDTKKKLQAREILQPDIYEHINAKKPTSSKVYVYMCYHECLVDLSSQLQL